MTTLHNFGGWKSSRVCTSLITARIHLDSQQVRLISFYPPTQILTTAIEFARI